MLWARWPHWKTTAVARVWQTWQVLTGLSRRPQKGWVAPQSAVMGSPSRGSGLQRGQ